MVKPNVRRKRTNSQGYTNLHGKKCHCLDCWLYPPQRPSEEFSGMVFSVAEAGEQEMRGKVFAEPGLCHESRREDAGLFVPLKQRLMSRCFQMKGLLFLKTQLSW